MRMRGREEKVWGRQTHRQTGIEAYRQTNRQRRNSGLLPDISEIKNENKI